MDIDSDTGPHMQGSAPVATYASVAMALREKCYAPSKLAALIEATTEAGLDATAVLEGTGLDREALANPFTLTSPQQFLTAAHNAIRRYDKTDLGVRVGRKMRASSYGMYGYALLCSETLGHAFDIAVKY